MAVDGDVLDLVRRCTATVPPGSPTNVATVNQNRVGPSADHGHPPLPGSLLAVAASDRDRLAWRPASGPPTPLLRATGALSTAAMARMEADMGWFRELAAEDRSWVGLIVQAGIKDFVDWYRRGVRTTPTGGGSAIAASVFGAAPRALTGVINLQQTVDLVRLTIEVVESNVDDIVGPARTPPTCTARSSCATPGRSPSPPPRSTPGPPRCAAPGTPGSRPWSSTPCSAPRPTRPCSPGRARWAGRRTATWSSSSGAAPAQRTAHRPLRRRTPLGAGRGHGRAVRHPGRPAGRGARRGRRPPEGRRVRSWTASARVRWSSGPVPTTSVTPICRPAPPSSAHRAARRLAGGAATGAQRRPAPRAGTRR